MNPTPHLERSLHQAIELIRTQVRTMTGLVERALEDSLTALLERNGPIAYSVVLRDHQIDELEKEIDRLCLEFLVRQQPAGVHLRFAYATIKINQELERIGDYAESVARQSLLIRSLQTDIPLDRYRDIARVAIPMVGRSIQAFMEQNEKLAWDTMAEEEKANEIRDEIISDIYRWRQADRIPMELLTPLLMCARRFERVADQSKNICEEVLYLCTGRSMKHLGSEVFRILFVDDDNACLSQIAESIGAELGQRELVFSSAGVTPRPVDPRAVAFLRSRGVDISDQITKSIEQIPNLEHYQVIVALSKAGRKAFPPPPTRTVSIEWKVPDAPAASDSSGAGLDAAYTFLQTQIQDLAQAMLGRNPSTPNPKP